MRLETRSGTTFKATNTDSPCMFIFNTVPMDEAMGIIFDLYSLLIGLNEDHFIKALPNWLGVRARRVAGHQ